MKHYIIFFGILITLVFSCKKKDDEQSPPATSTSTGAVPDPKFYGFLGVKAEIKWNGNDPYLDTVFIPDVRLQSEPSYTTNILKGINGGTLYLNDTRLKYYSSFYYDTTFRIKCRTSRNFNLISNGSLPGFNVSVQDSFPNLPQAYNTSLEDTMFKSKAYVVPLSSISYPDEIECYIYQQSTFEPFIKKTIKKGGGDLTLSQSEISVFPDNALLNCQITLRKFNDKNIDGKDFRFSCNSVTSFNIKVRP